MTALLERLLAPDPPPFAVLHRPETGDGGAVDVLVGEIRDVGSLAEVPLPEVGTAGRHEALVLVPYRQIAERGYDCVDDGTPLRVLCVTEQETVAAQEFLALVPDGPIALRDGAFDVDDATYAGRVRSVVDDEIGTGQGANFVLRRTYRTRIDGFDPAALLTMLRRLMTGERGAYWTFAVHAGDRCLVGASPERHVSLDGATAVMNPVSGTYRYPPSGPTLPELMAFLADGKETDELFMVVDEELKMMSRICRPGVRVLGPYLKEMARLAHTEYVLEGECDADPRTVLRETMFAPTVTGSPLENASTVIARHEDVGRGYYSGVLALIGRDGDGAPRMDSSILIRTAEVDRTGELALGVGATLVRHSDPRAEVAETAAKAAGVLGALGAHRGARFREHPEVCAALTGRNDRIARFWLQGSRRPSVPDPDLAGRRVLIVDAEDTFTSMIACQLDATGLSVDVRRFDSHHDLDAYDLVVLGPGPGDPRDAAHPKIAYLTDAVRTLWQTRRPFLAVCLSHQVVCTQLGLPIVRRAAPSQGEQLEIDLFGSRERVGFYNTFAARSDTDRLDDGPAGPVHVSRDPITGEVHALRARRFASLQFHAESVLTRDGQRIMTDRLREVVAA